MMEGRMEMFLNKTRCKGMSRGILEALGEQFPCTLYERGKGESVFQFVECHGYVDPAFRYEFLKQNPSLLSSVLEKGSVELPSEYSYLPDYHLWAVVEEKLAPHSLLLVEIPEVEEGVALFLRCILSWQLSFRGVSLPSSGSSPVDLPVWLQDFLPKLSSLPSPILISAEPGSGKEELVISFLKEKYGNSEAAVFFHPGRLSQAVQLRELFGDPAGARLGGSGSGIPVVQRKEGVVVVQEVGDLSSHAQLRLLAQFQSSDDDKLWLLETSRKLDQMVQSESFLSGFYDLIKRNTMTLPPLRECMNRLPEEVDRLMGRFRSQYRRQVNLTTDAHKALLSYHWPGNWRELKNTLESAFLMASEGSITLRRLRLGHWSNPEDWDDLNLRRHSESMERALLLRAYALHSGNQVQMARALGISRGSLQYKMDKYRFN